MPCPLSAHAQLGVAVWSYLKFILTAAGGSLVFGTLISFSYTTYSPTLQDNDFPFSPPSTPQPSSSILTLSWWACFLIPWDNRAIRRQALICAYPLCLPSYYKMNFPRLCTQNMVLNPDCQHHHHLEDDQTCKFYSPIPELLNQHFWGGAWKSVFQLAFQAILMHTEV